MCIEAYGRRNILFNYVFNYDTVESPFSGTDQLYVKRGPRFYGFLALVIV